MFLDMDIENKNKEVGENCVCIRQDYRDYRLQTKMDWNGLESVKMG